MRALTLLILTCSCGTGIVYDNDDFRIGNMQVVHSPYDRDYVQHIIDVSAEVLKLPQDFDDATISFKYTTDLDRHLWGYTERMISPLGYWYRTRVNPEIVPVDGVLAATVHEICHLLEWVHLGDTRESHFGWSEGYPDYVAAQILFAEDLP